MVDEARQSRCKPLLVPARVALRPEEHGPLVVVDAVDCVAQFMREIRAHLGADESGRARHEECLRHAHLQRGAKEQGVSLQEFPIASAKAFV